MAVVGAGPAGSVCARDLASNGFRVVLVDRAAPPRYKTCGGGIVGRALEALDLDARPAIERTSSRVEVRLQGHEPAFAVERSPAPVVMVMRSKFDALLVDAARRAGVVMWHPAVFEGLCPSGSRVAVRTSRGALDVAWVIGADGAGSRVARAARRPRLEGTVAAIESEIKVPDEIFAKYCTAARFDLGVPDDGYAWVFPKRRHLSVGCLSTRAGGRHGASSSSDLKTEFEGYLRLLGLDRALAREDHGFVIPTRPRSGGRTGGPVLLVGDAAGLADPLTCEGISNAIRSGRLAARALCETRSSARRTAARYEELLGEEILPELRRARRLAPLLFDHPRLRTFVFSRAGRGLCEAFTDVFSGRRTYRELLGRPAAYARFLGALMGARAAGGRRR